MVSQTSRTRGIRRRAGTEEEQLVAFIMEPQVIDRILDHFRRTAAARRRSRARPARARMVRAAAGSGFA